MRIVVILVVMGLLVFLAWIVGLICKDLGRHY